MISDASGESNDTRDNRWQAEITDAAKNWLAMDGLWFLAVEQTYGIEAAIACDIEVWKQFSAIEARRIKTRLRLPEHGGLEALEHALRVRLFSFLDIYEIHRTNPCTLELRMITCRTQDARERKGLAFFPCKQIGMVDYPRFAETIDQDIRTTCISCPPDEQTGEFRCAWRFTINSGQTP